VKFMRKASTAEYDRPYQAMLAMYVW